MASKKGSSWSSISVTHELPASNYFQLQVDPSGLLTRYKLLRMLFNLIGFVIWFPVPAMRKVVLKAACTLGIYTYYWRIASLIYILVVFVAVPGACLLISLLCSVSVTAGVVVTILALDGVVFFLNWWIKAGGCLKVVSEDEREARKAEIEEEMGLAEPREEPREQPDCTV